MEVSGEVEVNEDESTTTTKPKETERVHITNDEMLELNDTAKYMMIKVTTEDEFNPSIILERTTYINIEETASVPNVEEIITKDTVLINNNETANEKTTTTINIPDCETSMVETTESDKKQTTKKINDEVDSVLEFTSEEKSDDEETVVVPYVCSREGDIHAVVNLVGSENSVYCKNDYRFDGAFCVDCKKLFVDRVNDTTKEFKPTKKKPMYCCINAKEYCTYAMCYSCYMQSLLVLDLKKSQN
jgi:hypothetical protein